MKISTFFSVLSILTLASALNVKRGAETNATLYAYGTNTSSWPIAYGINDGLLYITQTPDDTTANLTPVSWNIASITDEDWIANATFANGSSAGSMYINPAKSNAVCVEAISQIAGDINGTVSGFALFASQLVFNNNTNLEAQFWAQPTTTEGIYALIWNEDNNVASESFPVVVKASED